jgi:hypothetical protein
LSKHAVDQSILRQIRVKEIKEAIPWDGKTIPLENETIDSAIASGHWLATRSRSLEIA